MFQDFFFFFLLQQFILVGFCRLESRLQSSSWSTEQASFVSEQIVRLRLHIWSFVHVSLLIIVNSKLFNFTFYF